MGCSFKRQKVANAFQKFLDESGCKLNTIWVDKGSEFYNKSLKSWLQDNNKEMYSTHNEGESAVAERFIRKLKNKIYKQVTSISKNVYIDKFADIANKDNNAYHSTIKMNPIDVKSLTSLTLMKKIMIKVQNLRLMTM